MIFIGWNVEKVAFCKPPMILQVEKICLANKNANIIYTDKKNTFRINKAIHVRKNASYIHKGGKGWDMKRCHCARCPICALWSNQNSLALLVCAPQVVTNERSDIPHFPKAWTRIHISANRCRLWEYVFCKPGKTNTVSSGNWTPSWLVVQCYDLTE